MTITSKVLIPNKEWIITSEHSKIGSINKSKKGYNFFRKGFRIPIKNEEQIKNDFDLELDYSKSITEFKMDPAVYAIYNFNCSSKPYNPVYNLKKKLPLFSKSLKSKSLYCAGFYAIKFRKGWVKSFCPKLITLERYSYYGPYKTEKEMKSILNTVNKNETT